MPIPSHFATTLKKRRRSRRARLPEGASVLVIGNGMVAARFCEQLVARGLHEHWKITVVGDEPEAPYDRIRLSDYVDHRDGGRLRLLPGDWHARHGVEQVTGKRIHSIDRGAGLARADDGSEWPYDALVLATGSRPFVPPIEGTDLPGVHPYRNLADIRAIIAAAGSARTAAIIGGGLLGLEAAQAVQKLGLEASVIERAKFLMPQQLNATASAHLEERVRELGISLHLSRSTRGIRRSPGGLELEFTEGPPLRVDLVILSAGITPNSEIAADSGLATGARGGVVVNEHLETQDPSIFAIGECALLHGRVWGLAAPGFAMAAHLADRLEGKRVLPLPEPDLSTRLKMLGVEVTTIGTPLEEGNRTEFSSPEGYRLLLTGPRRELKGALGVGPWEEAGSIQGCFRERAILRPGELDSFRRHGRLNEAAEPATLSNWPDHRIVCNCMGLSKGELTACVARCGSDPGTLSSTTGAGGVCGSCRPLLDQLCGQAPVAARPIGRRPLLVLSAAALVVVLAVILAPSPPMSDSVLSWRYQLDQLWRDSQLKQVSGFTLAGVFSVGLLVSARKRIRWFRLGHFARWRVFHALFGLTSLGVLFAHTGFRFGHNLNFWLMLVFVVLNLLGATAGIVAAVEQRGTTPAALAARRLRPLLIRAHIVLFWPLPALLIFHVLSVYSY